MREAPRLRQILSGWQIFFIVFTVVIGSGCFTDYGVVARTIGPFGLLVTVVVVGSIAICAMEGLSEMTQLFPTVNPIVELVHEFVDEDLALCVGISYWFAYASIMAVQVARAASYISFFVDTTDLGWLLAVVAIFYIIVPAGITMLNCLNVGLWILGVIESLGGLLKLTMLLVIVFMLYEIAGAGRSAAYFTWQVQSTLADSDVSGSALCLAIETIAFSFLGIESMMVTAFEAKADVDLRLSSKFMAYAVFWCYLILAIAVSLCLDWNNQEDVPDLLGQRTVLSGPLQPGSSSSTQSALVIAALQVSERGIALAMNTAFIFCALSAANSSLYVSSRMLFGLAYTNRHPSDERWFDRLASVGGNGVPTFAVKVSALFFVWIPFTQIKDTRATSQLISWFATSGSICIFFMWGSLSLAYIRYWFAFHRYQNDAFLNEPERQKFVRRRDSKGYSTLLDWAQPVPAFVGLIGSVLIVWVFSSAFFWGRDFSAGQFIQYYTMPLLLLIPLLARKSYVWLRRRRAGSSISEGSFREWLNKFKNRNELSQAIHRLSIFSSKPSRRYRPVPIDMQSGQEDETK